MAAPPELTPVSGSRRSASRGSRGAAARPNTGAGRVAVRLLAVLAVCAGVLLGGVLGPAMTSFPALGAPPSVGEPVDHDQAHDEPGENRDGPSDDSRDHHHDHGEIEPAVTEGSGRELRRGIAARRGERPDPPPPPTIRTSARPD